MKVLKPAQIIAETIVQEEDEGFMALIGKDVEVFCGVYIYAGKLVGVNTSSIKLANPHIVYETGSFGDKKFKDAQSMKKEFHYIQTHFVESFGETTRL